MVARRAIEAGSAVVRVGLDTAGISKQVSSIAGILGGLKLGSILTDAAQQGLAFERSFAASTSIISATEKQMESLRRTSLRVARDVKFSGAELNEAFFFLFSAGDSVEAAERSLGTVARFAQVARTDLSTAVDLLTDAQTALGLTSDDSSVNSIFRNRLADLLVQGNTIANASAAQISESLTNGVAVQGSLLGISVEEQIAAIGVLADLGIKGADAGTQLTIALRDLSTKATTNASAFEELGVSVFDSEGNFRSFLDVVRDVEKVLQGQSTRTQRQILLQLGFADKSIKALLSFNGLSGKLAEKLAALEDAPGAVLKAAEAQLTDFDKSAARLAAAIEEFGVQLFGAVDGPLGEFFSSGSRLIESLNVVVRQLEAAFPKPESSTGRSGSLLGTPARAVDAALDTLNARSEIARLRKEQEEIARSLTDGKDNRERLEKSRALQEEINDLNKKILDANQRILTGKSLDDLEKSQVGEDEFFRRRAKEAEDREARIAGKSLEALEAETRKANLKKLELQQLDLDDEIKTLQRAKLPSFAGDAFGARQFIGGVTQLSVDEKILSKLTELVDVNQQILTEQQKDKTKLEPF